MFYVYILQSLKTLRYYTGSCENVPTRLHEHNTGQNKSTHSGIPWRLVRTEDFPTRSEAVRKEKAIKNRGAGRYLDGISKSPTG